jgi:hypothetical protein
MRGQASAAGYLAWIWAGLVCTLLVVAGAVQFMQHFAPQHLPAPAISNRLDLDEKLLFLRRHPDRRPTVLGVGSSITMRSLDGAPFSGGPSSTGFLNVGIGGAQIHQTRETGKFYLDLFPEIAVVVQLVVPPDFEDCSTQPRVLFDPTDARAFVRGEMSSVRAYLKYFNPEELIPEALHIAADRERSSGGDVGQRLQMDEFGSMPMEMTPREARRRHETLYSETRPLDPNCFRELREWSREVRERGARHVVVVPPFSPIFLRTIPGAPEYIETFVQMLSTTLRNEPADLIDERSIAFGDEAFADAYHLLWPAARVFSRHVAADLEQQARAMPKAPTTPESRVVGRLLKLGTATSLVY